MEMRLRLEMPFSTAPAVKPRVFVPGVGAHLEPGADIRFSNFRDFWQISRTNSLGFVDREPRAANASDCRIAFVGDSFVEALEVPVAAKLHVRLEELASEKLPHLKVATAAYGRRYTGQVHQLGYYDKWIRHSHPHLVVLVFVYNDFLDNSSWRRFADHPPYIVAVPEDTGFVLRPPDPNWRAFQPPFVLAPASRRHEFANWLSKHSFFIAALRRNQWHNPNVPCAAHNHSYVCLADKPVPEPRFTGFALDQWKERTQRDGASLVLLASYTMGTNGDTFFDHLQQLAEPRKIPIVDQYDYILRQGADPEAGRWEHDKHWNPRGHQWAAEAMLEWLEDNPEVCDGGLSA